MDELEDALEDEFEENDLEEDDFEEDELEEEELEEDDLEEEELDLAERVMDRDDGWKNIATPILNIRKKAGLTGRFFFCPVISKYVDKYFDSWVEKVAGGKYIYDGA